MRHRVFLGVAIIALGILFLLSSLLELNVWRFFWPFILITAGIWFLLAPAFSRSEEAEVEKYSLPLEEAEEANVRVEHGVGVIKISALKDKENLLSGEFVGGVNPRVTRTKNGVRVTLSSKADFFHMLPHFPTGKGLGWDLQINKDIPLKLKLETGASDNQLDLTDLQVRELKLETGASTTNISLPKNAGTTKVKVSSGAASLEIHVPKTTAARIRVEGLVTKDIDQERFPLKGKYYQSEDYESAKNKAEIRVESGLSTVEIK